MVGYYSQSVLEERAIHQREEAVAGERAAAAAERTAAAAAAAEREAKLGADLVSEKHLVLEKMALLAAAEKGLTESENRIQNLETAFAVERAALEDKHEESKKTLTSAHADRERKNTEEHRTTLAEMESLQEEIAVLQHEVTAAKTAHDRVQADLTQAEATHSETTKQHSADRENRAELLENVSNNFENEKKLRSETQALLDTEKRESEAREHMLYQSEPLPME